MFPTEEDTRPTVVDFNDWVRRVRIVSQLEQDKLAQERQLTRTRRANYQESQELDELYDRARSGFLNGFGNIQYRASGEDVNRQENLVLIVSGEKATVEIRQLLEDLFKKWDNEGNDILPSIR